MKLKFQVLCSAKSLNTFKHPSDNAICAAASRSSCFVLGSVLKRRRTHEKQREAKRSAKIFTFDVISVHISIIFSEIYIANVPRMVAPITSLSLSSSRLQLRRKVFFQLRFSVRTSKAEFSRKIPCKNLWAGESLRFSKMLISPMRER